MFRNNYDNDSVTLYVVLPFQFIDHFANVGAAHLKVEFFKLNMLKKLWNKDLLSSVWLAKHMQY